MTVGDCMRMLPMRFTVGSPRSATALDARDAASAAALFGDECFWRDLVAFTWNVKTLEGRDEIAAMLAAQLDSVGPTAWRVEERADRCGRSSRSLGPVRDEARSRARPSFG